MALKTKVVGGYTVSQMGALESARLRLHQRNVSEQKLTDEAMLMALDEWMLVAACVTPFISQADYMAMPVTETRPLLEAVEELNADVAETSKKKPED